MSSLAHLIPADFARRHLRTGRELVRQRHRRPAVERLTTGVEAVDTLLGGGLERGALCELSGRRGGRFSLALSTLAAATSSGEAAALVDLGDALDPQLAAEAGVELERLLWARPRTLKEALSSVEAILATAMPLVVLDLGLPPVPGGRGHEASWLRLARSAQDQRVALLVSSPYRVSGTSAHTVLELRPERASWSGRGYGPRLLGGLHGRLELIKGSAQSGVKRGHINDVAPRSLGWRTPSPVAEVPAAPPASQQESAPAKPIRERPPSQQPAGEKPAGGDPAGGKTNAYRPTVDDLRARRAALQAENGLRATA